MEVSLDSFIEEIEKSLSLPLSPPIFSKSNLPHA